MSKKTHPMAVINGILAILKNVDHDTIREAIGIIRNGKKKPFIGLIGGVAERWQPSAQDIISLLENTQYEILMSILDNRKFDRANTMVERETNYVRKYE